MRKQYFLRKDRVSFVGTLAAVFGLFLVACGGGGSQGSHQPPPGPSVIALPSNTDAQDSANLANNIWTIHADGTSATELTNYHGDANVTPEALQPIFSPDGSKILYVSDGAFDGSNTFAQYYYFWVMNADGSGKMPLSNVGPAAYTVVGNAADWSHDGKKIVVAASPGNGINTYIMNTDGSNPTSLLGQAFGAVWSPDDSKLALQGPDNGIWTIHADGSSLTELYTVPINYVANAPVWSPDGTKLAFAVANLQFGGFTIQTMNADGSNQKSYPGSTYFYNHMVGRIVNWSPDSSKLVFPSTAALDGNSNSPDVSSLNIWVMNADGTGRRPLTQYTANGVVFYVPTWSPDGSTIAVLSNAALDGSDAPSLATWCIWTMGANGNALAPMKAVANGTGWNTFWLQPSWKP
jgi:Tol biopolymer transport system component